MWVKICGVCDVQSAKVVVSAGADAMGLNFISRSKRFITVEQARSIADSVRGRIELVGVMEHVSVDQALARKESLGLDRIQLHVDMMKLVVTDLPAWAYAAVGLAARDEVGQLVEAPGEPLLVDACVGGKSGGTGTTFDWNWVVEIAKGRRIVLAGGLTPGNVHDAIAVAHPWGVDVASGVEFEGIPRVKDPQRVAQFIERARKAKSF